MLWRECGLGEALLRCGQCCSVCCLKLHPHHDLLVLPQQRRAATSQAVSPRAHSLPHHVCSHSHCSDVAVHHWPEYRRRLAYYLTPEFLVLWLLLRPRHAAIGCLKCPREEHGCP